MERYTQYRDKATGISPFLPNLQTNVIGTTDTPVGKFIKQFKLDLLPKILLSSIKLVFIIPFLTIYIALSYVLDPATLSPLLRIILFIVGLFSYELSIQNIKTKQINNKSFYPSKNQIYFVNYSSPFDPLILSLISNDDFVLLLPDFNGGLYKVSIFELIQNSLKGCEIKHKTHRIDINEFKDKIVYIFAEGTTSNNKAILPFLLSEQHFKSFDSLVWPIKTISIKLYPSILVTPLSLNPFAYIFKVLSQYSINIKVRINLIDELNSKESNLIKIRNSFTNNGKFKLIGDELNYKTKQTFIKSYNGRV